MKKYLILMAFMMGPMVASAGIIAPDGNEWELRGSYTDVAGHTVEAAADTGWIWASLADWTASGLNNVQLFQPDLDLFEGSCDGTELFCSSWLSSQGTYPGAQDHIWCSDCAEVPPGPRVQDRFFAGVHLPTFAGFRVSFREQTAAVPEPTSVALLGMSLLGLGIARRRVKR